MQSAKIKIIKNRTFISHLVSFYSHTELRKLVLHLDLNNTILVSDAITGQGTVAALDYFLTTVTWGKMGKHGNGTRTASHTHTRHNRTRDLFSSCSVGHNSYSELSVKGEDGRLYHWILPSFFQLLKDLVQDGREFAIVFRTFGSDLPRALRAVSRALNEGAHPLFPDLADLKISVNMSPGKIRCSKRGIVLSRVEDHVSTRDGERGLYQYLSSVQGLGGFQDHFDWWASNTFSIRGGKPLWVDPFDQHVQHIFIDDNIRMNDEDTIVQPKVFLDPGGSETRLACTFELYDITLVQNNLLRAISDLNYFTERVHICLENYERNLQQGAG
uniref:Si:dkey-32e6.3 n=1 Tax=Scophthalmus maximus TaxID=52904 RepID=A0A8D3CL96_SCOMX